MQLSISRYNPELDAKPYMQDYTFTLRKSCREGVCGSDAMNINGRNGLACVMRLKDLKLPVVIRPLPGFPIIRDLVVDMTNFFKQYHSVSPYLINAEPPPEKERLQSPSERDKLDGAYACRSAAMAENQVSCAARACWACFSVKNVSFYYILLL